MDLDADELSDLRERIREELRAEITTTLARKGGYGRAKALTKKRRSQIARKAAKIRWASVKARRRAKKRKSA